MFTLIFIDFKIYVNIYNKNKNHKARNKDTCIKNTVFKTYWHIIINNISHSFKNSYFVQAF